jgi:tripartite-type tricarboxylate transporter receptor subunit TctC
MKPPRRRFLQLAAASVALPALSRIARAQSYPTKPVRIIVGFSAAGTADIIARVTGQWLSERLPQQFVIENRTGAGGNIGTEAVVKAPPDGYTLLLVAPTNAINAMLYDKLDFNFIRDIAPVASVMRTPGVMEVNPSFPAKTVPEFIAYAKANPGKLNMAIGGIGTAQHTYGELFKMLAGVDLVPVFYRGSRPALTDLIAGRVQVLFDILPSSMGFIKAGTVRALAVSTATRWETLPDIPTIAEFVPGYEASSWYGIGAPSNTPAEIVEKLNKEINAGLTDPKFKLQLAAVGGMALPGSPADFKKLIADETEKWGKVIRAANIKAG